MWFWHLWWAIGFGAGLQEAQRLSTVERRKWVLFTIIFAGTMLSLLIIGVIWDTNTGRITWWGFPLCKGDSE